MKAKVLLLTLLKKMKTILTICIFLAIAWNTTAQTMTAKQSDSIEYHHENFLVQYGVRGAAFIVDDGLKVYVSAINRVRTGNGATDNGNGTITYKGNTYKRLVGNRGGVYFIYQNRKIYLTKN